MIRDFTRFCLWIMLGFICVVYLYILPGCGATQQDLDTALDKAADLAEGYVRVHNVIADNVDDLQDFCLEMHELSAGTPLQTRIDNACRRAKEMLDVIREVDNKILLREYRR